jgi:hypothetical protein
LTDKKRDRFRGTEEWKASGVKRTHSLAREASDAMREAGEKKAAAAI